MIVCRCMRELPLVLAVSLPLLALAGPAARANDTTAVLGSGGLVFTRSDMISMESEDLYISPTSVKVDYVYRNTGKSDISTIVAFPMPKIGGPVESMADIPNMESDNFMDFSVIQDGREIEPNLQQRVLVQGLDFTDEVIRQGISLQPVATRTVEAIARLAPAVQKDWEDKGLIVNMAYSEDGSAPAEYYPVWQLETVYWWQTSFPAGREVRVQHSYRPSVGGTTAMTFIQDGKPNDFFADYEKRYCLDADFMKLAARLEKQQNYDTGKYYFEKWLSYILMTGGNWYGPIGKFHLTVDKGDAANFVSFCGTGVTKTGPTTFEMTASDFIPAQDLDILLIVPSQP